MRTRDEILTGIYANIRKAHPETEAMLYHEYCYIEVMLDIRDTLRDLAKALSDKKEIRL